MRHTLHLLHGCLARGLKHGLEPQDPLRGSLNLWSMHLHLGIELIDLVDKADTDGLGIILSLEGDSAHHRGIEVLPDGGSLLLYKRLNLGAIPCQPAP